MFKLEAKVFERWKIRIGRAETVRIIVYLLISAFKRLQERLLSGVISPKHWTPLCDRRATDRTFEYGQFTPCMSKFGLKAFQSFSRSQSFKFRAWVVSVQVWANLAQYLDSYGFRRDAVCAKGKLIGKRWAKLQDLVPGDSVPNRNNHTALLDLKARKSPKLVFRPGLLDKVRAYNDEPVTGFGKTEVD